MGEDWELSLSWLLSCKNLSLEETIKIFKEKRKRFIL